MLSYSNDYSIIRCRSTKTGKTLMQLTQSFYLVMLCITLISGSASRPSSFQHNQLSFLATQSDKSLDRERDKTYARQQFNKNFSELQVAAQKLLKEHEQNRLTSSRLASDTKAINKCAKTLRSLVVLGDQAIPLKVKKDIETPQDFDKSIRDLAKHVWDFAHNPIHQNSKVFNTDLAEQAQTDLLAVIDISKAIENNAKKYAPLPSLPKQ